MLDHSARSTSNPNSNPRPGIPASRHAGLTQADRPPTREDEPLTALLIALLAAALIIVAVVVVDLALDRRWLDVALLLLALGLLGTSGVLQHWARSELIYRPLRKRRR